MGIALLIIFVGFSCLIVHALLREDFSIPDMTTEEEIEFLKEQGLTNEEIDDIIG